ncbi:sigma 54-interacting transcriptional regulator, partial [Neobacillus niacini]|uniref:sigma-54-dependent Fis family transcriptional regulator n=1 Tax=Neobacillus niacini TaxID=86668 RepID=UPI002FFFC10F
INTPKYNDFEFESILEQNVLLLNIAEKIIKDLIDKNANNLFSIFITNREGILLTTTGTDPLNRKFQTLYQPGTNWAEFSAGTNAIGTSLYEKKPMQVFAGEHYCKMNHSLVGSAAPICDPFTKEPLGVLCLARFKDLVNAKDIYIVLNRKQHIEQMIRTKLVNENYLNLNSLLQSDQNPLLFFNNGGIITSFNKIAPDTLQIQVGDSILKFIDPEIFTAMEEHHYQSPNGYEWRIKIQPYELNGTLYGGLATFHRPTVASSVSFMPTKGQTRYNFQNIITQDDELTRIIHVAKKASHSEKSILLSGETGTGKEVFAQSIHAYGPRKTAPFIGVNCGAIPKELIASELFGYEGGAFTGANAKGKKGRFQLAHEGTIFLDEIGDLPLDIQVYLLRVLEERNVLPVGGTKPISINVRVIAATHKDLKQEIAAGRFREDLYYRLNVIQLTIPPLRKRSGDIALLARLFIENNNYSDPPCISPRAMGILESYTWPGNIRQLKNVIEQILFYLDKNIIEVSDLPKEIHEEETPTPENTRKTENNLVRKKVKKNHLSNNILISTLKSTNGNISQAAKLLNTSRMTIYRLIKRMEAEGEIILDE